MSPEYLKRGSFISRFPRVSGDEPAKRLTHDGNQEFSPRERG